MSYGWDRPLEELEAGREAEEDRLAEKQLLAGRVVECSTQGRRSGLYRVIFNSEGEAQAVDTILSSSSRWRRRRLWRLSDDKAPGITACCAIRAAIGTVKAERR